jgi:hypothetical protein
MPGNLYTRKELFILRNDIPVDSLIEELGIPFKISEGYFRFGCPVCREFNTSVNPKTNLARCFRRKKNYNTIDFVKIVRGVNFKNSVEFLKKIHGKTDRTAVSKQHHPIKKTTTASPVSISKIFETMETAWKSCNDSAIGNQKANDKPTTDQHNKRILRLEQQVKYLLQKIIEQKN